MNLFVVDPMVTDFGLDRLVVPLEKAPEITEIRNCSPEIIEITGSPDVEVDQ